MPKKKSIKGSANEFKAEVDKILTFLTASAGLGDEHVSWCHDLAIIRLYRAFESLMLDTLVGALNNDTSTLSIRTGFAFPKHLTDEVCRFLVTGRGYFDFKGRDGLIKTLKQYLPDGHYLITVVSKPGYRNALDLLTAARNYAAHESQKSKTAFKKATGQNRVGAAGSWLKRQNRFGDIADKLKGMADESRDGVDDLGGSVWRLGDSRRSPVLLARDIVRLWREPALLDRVRVAGGDIRVITPKPRETRGAPFGAGVEWLALEDRFAFYGGGISFIGAPGEQSPVQAVDPTMPVHGPFSADFKWVTLPGEEGRPIRCTDGQAAVFRALWSFKGEPRSSEQVMGRAQLSSQKPIDVFKGKKYAEPLRAYQALVTTQQRAGLYSMACAAAPSLASA